MRDVVRREAQIAYLPPTIRERKEARIVCFSDAGFPHPGENKNVVQERYVFGLSIGTEKGSKFHTLGWLSRKQRRVSYSSNQAEATAAKTSVGRALNSRTVWENITGKIANHFSGRQSWDTSVTGDQSHPIDVWISRTSGSMR